MYRKIIFFISSFSIIGLFFLFFNTTNIAYAQAGCTTPSGQSCSSVGGVCDGFGNCYYDGMTCLAGCSNGFDLNRCQTTQGSNGLYNSCSSVGSDSGGRSFCCYFTAPSPTPTLPPPPTPTPTPRS